MKLTNMSFEKEGGVAILTINRPDKMNAMTTTMWEDFRRMINYVHKDEQIKVLIFTGTGQAFCAGSDIGERLARRAEVEDVGVPSREVLEPLHYVALRIRALDKVTIAAINGIAVGAGLSIALLCDLCLASEKARFGATWVKIGLIPDLGLTYTLPRTLGISKALDLMLSGKIVDSHEAERLGLVTRIIDHDKLMSEARALACRLAEGPSIAIALIKRAVYKGLHNDLLGQLDFEGYARNVCLQTESHKKAVNAFLKKG